MSRQLHPPRQNGFTLVEVMVGMVISLIGMIMMFQAMTSWEARKRTTSAGSDAQVTGSIAMFTLERDLKLAGYGFGNAAAIGCTIDAYDSSRAAPGRFSFPMVPVLITQGAGGAPDTLAVLYGSGTTMSSAQTFSNLTAVSMRMNTRTGMRRGDLVIAADGGNAVCGLFEVVGNANALSIDFGTGGYTNYMNNANVTGSVAAVALSATALEALQAKFLNNSGVARYNDNTVPVGLGIVGAAFNLGTAPRLNVWQITNRRFLTFTNTLDNQVTPIEVAEGIVNLQAEYGVDTDADGIVEWTAAAPAVWTQLRAVRVGLLARSQQFEKNNVLADGTEVPVTPNAPTWAGGAFIMTNLDGTADTNPGTPNDWRRYRYRVYETVIPLRNMLWGMD
jgi:type IV pilus assembly protein PilW